MKQSEIPSILIYLKREFIKVFLILIRNLKKIPVTNFSEKKSHKRKGGENYVERKRKRDSDESSVGQNEWKVEDFEQLRTEECEIEEDDNFEKEEECEIEEKDNFEEEEEEESEIEENGDDTDWQISDEESVVSFNEVDIREDLAIQKITMDLFSRDPEYYLGIQAGNMVLIDIICGQLKITKRDLFIIFFKIRRNESLKSIADRFGISISRVSQIIASNIEALSINLKQFINVQISNNDVRRNLPLNFRNRFRSVRYIIDCFETPMGKLI